MYVCDVMGRCDGDGARWPDPPLDGRSSKLRRKQLCVITVLRLVARSTTMHTRSCCMHSTSTREYGSVENYAYY